MFDEHDPRVLFAAERTLLAWNRTSISLMAFGFVVERFGLFLKIVGREEIEVFQRHISFVVGISFILLGALVALFAVWQHMQILKTIRQADIPPGYVLKAGMLVTGINRCTGNRSEHVSGPGLPVEPASTAGHAFMQVAS